MKYKWDCLATQRQRVMDILHLHGKEELPCWYTYDMFISSVCWNTSIYVISDSQYITLSCWIYDNNIHLRTNCCCRVTLIRIINEYLDINSYLNGRSPRITPTDVLWFLSLFVHLGVIEITKNHKIHMKINTLLITLVHIYLFIKLFVTSFYFCQQSPQTLLKLKFMTGFQKYN